ncbi:hypothetical protein [Mesorhizobium sp. LjNodule214]|uniref:hypothetical protein n=1 Tax=Mesorhizobium sp. LjNodule214 TaxID=3342252 RepID=UPI003ECDAE95
MFTSSIGRLRFFLYSLAATVAEIVVIVVCIAGTIGFDGLINSTPGPSRQGMAGVILVMSLAFVLLRGNIAWRRSRDANGRSWILWAYIVFSAIYAVLQVGTLLVIDFGNPESVPGGLNLLGLSIFGLWVTILVAKPAGGVDIDELTSVFDFDGAVPAPAGGGRMAASAAPSAPRTAAPVAQPIGRPRPAGFGKRGL